MSVYQSHHTQDSSPKRSKLDFLAMIAEMSSKDEGDEKEQEVAEEDSPKPAASTSSGSNPTKDSGSRKPRESTFPVKKSSAANGDTPKSSFAAWKLAKGRKNGTKSPSRKELSVARKDIPASTPGIISNDYLLAASAAKKSLLTTSVADKKATMEPGKKDHGGPIKKSVPSKKDKGASSPKRNANKAAALAASKKGIKVGKVKPKKGDSGSLKAATFPKKIMELLQGDLAPTAIYWLPEGEAIAVDPDCFKDNTVISKQFRGNKLSSFVRSLNRW